MATIGLSIIAKDEQEKLLEIITKYYQYFDEICIAIDDAKTFEKLSQYNNKVKTFKYDHLNQWGLLDFAHKRNFIFDKATTDYIFRLDTDDEIINPEKIKDSLDFCERENISVLSMNYDYSKDADGNTNMLHWRETILKNDGNLYWNKPIHECILPRKLEGFKVARDETIILKHNIDKEHSDKSQLRNIKYLLKEYEEDKENTDPRTLAYLGRALIGIGQFEKAIFFLERHIKTSGWDDDRYLSWCDIARCLRTTGKIDEAKGAVMEALLEKPDFPDAYFELHDIYFTEGKWLKALEFGKMGFEKPFPQTNVPLDPSAYTWRPMLSMAMCYYQIGEFRKAKNLFDRAKKLAPTLPWIKENEKLFSKAVEHQEYVEHFIGLAKTVKDDKDRYQKLAESVPEELYEHDIIASIRNSALPPPVYGERSIVIYCASTADEWSPKSVEKGIGGSEEAVIHLAKELSNLHYDVEVYNNCGANEGTYDGVKYINFIKFNPKGRYNILISWRNNVFKLKVEAKRKIVWLHDLPRNIDFNNPDTNVQIDKLLVLSEYHKSLIPDSFPKEKIFVTTNGINPDDFKGIGYVERDPRRVIYASSYDRGLEEILVGWKDVLKEVPDASLHIFYGWNTYDKFVSEGWIKEDGFKARMLELMKQPNVFEHGRVGHKELAKEYFKSGVYAYPSKYAGEIQCIALTKAIASGCVAVTNDFAVLKERNPHVVVSDKEFIPALIKVLKSEEKEEIPEDYIKINSWKSVVEDWENRLFLNDIETVLTTRANWIWDNLDKDKTIVDIGSNKGHMFSDWDRSKITSVDIDEYDIPNFVRADASKLPFEDKKFEQAVLAEIVEHCSDPVAVIREAMRVSKKLVITVPYEHEWWQCNIPFNNIEKETKKRGMTRKELALDGNQIAKDIYSEDNYEHLYHLRYYTPETLKEDLEKADIKNYKIVKIRMVDWAWLGVLCG